MTIMDTWKSPVVVEDIVEQNITSRFKTLPWFPVDN